MSPLFLDFSVCDKCFILFLFLSMPQYSAVNTSAHISFSALSPTPPPAFPPSFLTLSGQAGGDPTVPLPRQCLPRLQAGLSQRPAHHRPAQRLTQGPEARQRTLRLQVDPCGGQPHGRHQLPLPGSYRVYRWVISRDAPRRTWRLKTVRWIWFWPLTWAGSIAVAQGWICADFKDAWHVLIAGQQHILTLGESSRDVFIKTSLSWGAEGITRKRKRSIDRRFYFKSP